MKVLLTGAHFTPAQAVAWELQKIYGFEVVYIGRKTTLEGDKTLSVESQVMPSLGIKFLSLIAGRLPGSLSIHSLGCILKIPIGFLQAFYYLFKEKPDVVVSFGGYVGVPVVLSAWLLSIPILIHEQTLVSGLANQISSYFANKIAISYPKHNLIQAQSKVILTGNPLRFELLNVTMLKISKELKKFITNAKKENKSLLLVTGGNQGSHFINVLIGKILDDLLDKAYLVHQTGDSKYRDFEVLNQKRMSLKFKDRYFIKKWINADEWGYLLRNVSLSISRAGANTLYEFAYFKIPTIAIPIPHLHKDEQVKNALFYRKLGLVTIVAQNTLTSEKLLDEINKLLLKKRDLKINLDSKSPLVTADASKKLALEIYLLAMQ